MQISALSDVQMTKGFMKINANMKSHLKCLTCRWHRKINMIQFSVQLLSRVQLFATP